MTCFHPSSTTQSGGAYFRLQAFGMAPCNATRWLIGFGKDVSTYGQELDFSAEASKGGYLILQLPFFTQRRDRPLRWV